MVGKPALTKHAGITPTIAPGGRVQVIGGPRMGEHGTVKGKMNTAIGPMWRVRLDIGHEVGIPHRQLRITSREG